jgi:beta-lactamase class A
MTLGTRRQRRRLPILPLFSWLAISLALGLFARELIAFSSQSDRFGGNVSVGGVAIDGLSPLEAMTRWEQAFAQPLTLWYDDSPIVLDPAALGFRTNREAMLADARVQSEQTANFWVRFFTFLTGRQVQAAYDIPLEADFQETLLRQTLDDIAARYDRAPGTADFDLATLTLRSGATGRTLDVEAAEALITAALRDPVNRTVVLPISTANANRPDIDSLRQLIIGYLDSEGFIYDGQSTVASVFIVDLETGAEVSINSDVAFSAASTVKLSILIEYFRTLLFPPNDDEAFLMAQSLLCSNNSSSNTIMRLIGGGTDPFAGIGRVTETMQFIGARNSFLSAPLFEGGDQVLGSIPRPPTSPNPNFNTGADPFNQTTTEDLVTQFTMVYDCAYSGSGLMTAYPNGEFTPNECRQMLELMSDNELGRLLEAGLPEGTVIAHKNGWLENVHGDAGIVFAPNGRNYAIAVYLWENGEFFSYTRAWPLIENISRAAWNYFVPEQPLIAPRTDLPETAVECIDFAPEYGEVNLDNIDADEGLPPNVPPIQG